MRRCVQSSSYDGLAVVDIMMTESENKIASEQISASFIEALMKGVIANDESE